MNAVRVILAIARADFLERVRRYSFIVTLLFAVYLGYATARGQISLRLGEYRGLYTSAWIGAMVSLITTTFVSLVGFYIIKNAVDRDRQTRVGEILAATPLSKTSYVLGKFLSNFAVLGSMVLVLAVAAVAMNLLMAEDRAFHPWALLSPFFLLSLPAIALTAALAVLFETIRFLRGGFGNVVWFFGWTLAISVPAIMKSSYLDPSGLWTVFQSMVPAAQAGIPGYKESFSLTIAEPASARIASGFHWNGVDWTTESVLLRLAWAAVAVAVALLAALFFDRFDPARARIPSPAKQQPADARRQATEIASVSGSQPATAVPVHLTPLAASAREANFARLFAAELRLALKGYPWWWYAVAAGLGIAEFASPLAVSRGLLTAAWIWPILIWSALGTRETRFGTQQLLVSCARVVPRQLPAAWLAGVALAVTLGLGTAVRLMTAGQGEALFAWVAGAIFVPSLGLALGIWTGTSRSFEGLYTALWYVGPLNHAPGLDFTGAGSGAFAGRYAGVYLCLAGILLASAFFGRMRQLRRIA